ncbi:hypothetical protein JCM10599A_67030 [Paraburkholderia kururiensis]
MIYTTNSLESVNAQLRKIIKTRGHFPSDDAATKPLWLALRKITAEWHRAAHDWKVAMRQFAILYEDRFTRPSVQNGNDRSRGFNHSSVLNTKIQTLPKCLGPSSAGGLSPTDGTDRAIMPWVREP